MNYEYDFRNMTLQEVQDATNQAWVAWCTCHDELQRRKTELKETLQQQLKDTLTAIFENGYTLEIYDPEKDEDENSIGACYRFEDTNGIVRHSPTQEFDKHSIAEGVEIYIA